MTEKKKITDLLLNNAMYIIIALAVIYIAIKVPAFVKLPSLVNILSLTAAKLPIALGIGGCIPDGGEASHCSGDRRLYRTDRYGYFRRPRSRSDGLYFRLSFDDYL